MQLEFSDVVAIISACIAILALLAGLYGTAVAHRLATSDFEAMEQVKVDTARLIAVLRALIVKGSLYTQQDPEHRDDPQYSQYVDISSELKAIEQFMNSPTALAYHSYVAEKSRGAREAGVEGERWRVFFLEMAELRLTKNPYVAARRAGRLERYFDELGEPELRKLSKNLGDLSTAITLLIAERQHDVLAHVFVEGNLGSSPVSEEDFMDFVTFLREVKRIDDPDLDLFSAVGSGGDTESARSALERGASVHVTSGEIVARYRELVGEFEQHRSAEGQPGS